MTSPGEGSASAGWHPDPWLQADLRWWDGGRWTTAIAPLPPVPPPPERTLPKQAAAFAVAGTVAIVVGTRVVAQALQHVLRSVRGEEALEWGFYVALYGGLFLLIRQLCARFGTGSLRDDLTPRFKWSDLGLGPALFVAARIAQVAVTTPILIASASVRASSQHYARVQNAQPASALITLTVVGILVAPFVEELLFRGVIQRGLISWVGSVWAAVIQGVLFGLYHFAPFLGLYNVLLLTANSTFGVIFGFMARHRRTLGTGMVAHAITNGTVLLVILANR